MHDHDLDLIAEHASGLLTGADAARADELVASCGSCAEEYRLHSEIRTLLATAPAPTMSEFERSRLRRAVLDELGPSRPAVRPWQQRFLAAAGGIAAVAVVAVGFGVFGQSDSGDDLTIAGESADTTMQAEALVPMDDGTDDADMGIMADEATEEADTAFDATESTSRLSSVLVDTGSEPADLDSILGEISAVTAEMGEPVPLDDLVAFGATCAPSIEEPIFGAVLTDAGSLQVFVVGDPVEPTIEYRATADCSPTTP
ncbi:MAG: hypothetical protein ACLGHX_12025 [Acidimicrobiia bacterium]